MLHLLNEKSTQKGLKACNFCATVVTVVLAAYWPAGQCPGPQKGGGNAWLVTWWFGTKGVLACDARTAAEQPIVNIPSTRALTANFMTVLLLKSCRDSLLQEPIYLLNCRFVFSRRYYLSII